MGHTEEPCEHHLKDVSRNKVGEQGQAHEVPGSCRERGFNWGERQHQRRCYKGWGPVFVWGGGVVPLQHLHGCLVWHAICNTACQQTHALSKYACGPSWESFEEDWARSPELQGKWLCDCTDGSQRHLWRNVEAVLKQKRLRSTKRHFSYESHDEPFSDAQKLEGWILQCCCWCSHISDHGEVFHTGKCGKQIWGFHKFFKSCRWGACRAMQCTRHHCTLKGTLIWTVESLCRKSRTSLTCHQKPWASLSLSFLCMIRIYRRSTPTFGLLSGMHLLCQSLWLREELFKTKVDQIVPEVNHVSGTAHWPCYNQYQSLNRGADFVWWHYWWFCIKEGPNGLVLVWVFCS